HRPSVVELVVLLRGQDAAAFEGRAGEEAARTGVDEDGVLDRRGVDLRPFVEGAGRGRDVDADVHAPAEEGLQSRLVHQEEDMSRLLRPDLEPVAALGGGDEGGGAPETARLVAD